MRHVTRFRICGRSCVPYPWGGGLAASAGLGVPSLYLSPLYTRMSLPNPAFPPRTSSPSNGRSTVVQRTFSANIEVQSRRMPRIPAFIGPVAWNPTNAQRTFNVCSTTVQRLLPFSQRTLASRSTNHYPLPITHRYLCGPGAGGRGVMLNARINFFSQKAGKPQQVPLWITGSSGYIRGNDETSVTGPRVPQAGCEVQLPQFEA